MKINILFLAAAPTILENDLDAFPLCLREVENVSLMERVIKNTSDIHGANYIFSFLKRESNRFHLDKIAKLLLPSASIIMLNDVTQGSACTALYSIVSDADDDSELLILSLNEYVDIDYSKVLVNFRSNHYDGGVLTFRSTHPRYSYVSLNEFGLVTEAAQQNPISTNATAGVFWFSRTGDFISASKNMIKKNANVNGKFFIAPVYNELILLQAKIGCYPISNDVYHPLKNERQSLIYETGAPI